MPVTRQINFHVGCLIGLTVRSRYRHSTWFMIIEEEVQPVPGVYLIINKIDGKFYVGSTKSLSERAQTHRLELKGGRHSNVHLQAAYTKHLGANFKFFVLAICSSKRRALKIEQSYLDLFCGKPYCYNLENTVMALGFKHRQPMSQSTRDKIGKNTSLKLKGYKHTEEARRNMSIAQKRLKQTKKY